MADDPERHAAANVMAKTARKSPRVDFSNDALAEDPRAKGRVRRPKLSLPC
jgi:hypothetical protein